jgi:hypothetical protein
MTHPLFTCTTAQLPIVLRAPLKEHEHDVSLCSAGSGVIGNDLLFFVFLAFTYDFGGGGLFFAPLKIFLFRNGSITTLS